MNTFKNGYEDISDDEPNRAESIECSEFNGKNSSKFGGDGPTRANSDDNISSCSSVNGGSAFCLLDRGAGGTGFVQLCNKPCPTKKIE